jgi:predicted DNA-binding protein with PD1-like motif
MSNGAKTTELPGPTFHIKAPGTAVIHAGPRQDPRIVSVPTRCTAHTIDLAEGTDVFTALEDSLGAYNAKGIMAEFVSGQLGHIEYVHPAYGPDAEHPMSFTQTFSVDGPADLRHASATVGFRDDAPFCHIHSSWTGADGTIKGGHLLPGTQAGPTGLRVRLFVLAEAHLVSDVDPETGFSAFAPQPFEPGSSDTTTSPTAPEAVISRVRPGELLDEAILTVARNAGFTSAEVVASLGSTTGAVFAVGTAPWPAVEFTHLAGSVTDTQSEVPLVALTGEVVDVAGEVSSGSLAPTANPVAVTFELFVRRIS